jgi:hypothetical protein
VRSGLYALKNMRGTGLQPDVTDHRTALLSALIRRRLGFVTGLYFYCSLICCPLLYGAMKLAGSKQVDSDLIHLTAAVMVYIRAPSGASAAVKWKKRY